MRAPLPERDGGALSCLGVRARSATHPAGDCYSLKETNMDTMRDRVSRVIADQFNLAEDRVTDAATLDSVNTLSS